MEAAFQYLLKVSIVISLIFLGYSLFFKGSTFFKLNRIYLVAGLILSFIIPLITLPEPVVKTSGVEFVPYFKVIDTVYTPMLHPVVLRASALTFLNVMTVIYIAGLIFLVFRASLGIRTVFAIKQNSVIKHIANTRVYINKSYPTFSFFNLIFVSHDEIDPLVVSHEEVHLQEKHWVDLAIVEIAAIVLWFNPVMIFYRRAIKSQHEFLADAGAIKKSDCVEEYLQCLVASLHRASGIPASSQFSSQSIKTRIVMMTKTKTPRYYNLLYLCLIPATAFLLLAFQKSPKTPPVKKEVQYVFSVQSVPSDLPVDIAKLQNVFAFGEKYNPVTTRMQNHTGTDFVINEGENVMATADGIVLDAGFDEVKGNYVVIQHGEHFATQYFHMRNVTAKKNASVRKGDVIGFVGSTGLSIKSHLHYEVLKDGKAVNPRDYIPEDKRAGC